MPIIKIDEPFFDFICNIQQPQTILFTNPSTVESTMERLKHYANNHQKSLDLEVIVINNTFELIMRGLKEEYNQEISKFQEDKQLNICSIVREIQIFGIKLRCSSFKIPEK